VQLLCWNLAQFGRQHQLATEWIDGLSGVKIEKSEHIAYTLKSTFQMALFVLAFALL
jgi:hypothetical protein